MIQFEFYSHTFLLSCSSPDLIHKNAWLYNAHQPIIVNLRNSIPYNQAKQYITIQKNIAQNDVIDMILSHKHNFCVEIRCDKIHHICIDLFYKLQCHAQLSTSQMGFAYFISLVETERARDRDRETRIGRVNGKREWRAGCVCFPRKMEHKSGKYIQCYVCKVDKSNYSLPLYHSIPLSLCLSVPFSLSSSLSLFLSSPLYLYLLSSTYVMT